LADDELLCGLASFCAELSHLLHNIHAVPNPAKNHMFEVQVLGFLQGDEELGVVGVAPTIGHWQNARACVPNIKVLILKLAAVDGLSSRAVTVGEVTALKKDQQGRR